MMKLQVGVAVGMSLGSLWFAGCSSDEDGSAVDAAPVVDAGEADVLPLGDQALTIQVEREGLMDDPSANTSKSVWVREREGQFSLEGELYVVGDRSTCSSGDLYCVASEVVPPTVLSAADAAQLRALALTLHGPVCHEFEGESCDPGELVDLHVNGWGGGLTDCCGVLNGGFETPAWALVERIDALAAAATLTPHTVDYTCPQGDAACSASERVLSARLSLDESCESLKGHQLFSLSGERLLAAQDCPEGGECLEPTPFDAIFINAVQQRTLDALASTLGTAPCACDGQPGISLQVDGVDVSCCAPEARAALIELLNEIAAAKPAGVH